MDKINIDINLKIELSEDTKQFIESLFSNMHSPDPKNLDKKTDTEKSNLFKGDYILLAESEETAQKLIQNCIGGIDAENEKKAEISLGKIKKGNRIFLYLVGKGIITVGKVVKEYYIAKDDLFKGKYSYRVQILWDNKRILSPDNAITAKEMKNFGMRRVNLRVPLSKILIESEEAEIVNDEITKRAKKVISEDVFLTLKQEIEKLYPDWNFNLRRDGNFSLSTEESRVFAYFTYEYGSVTVNVRLYPEKVINKPFSTWQRSERVNQIGSWNEEVIDIPLKDIKKIDEYISILELALQDNLISKNIK